MTQEERLPSRRSDCWSTGTCWILERFEQQEGQWNGEQIGDQDASEREIAKIPAVSRIC